MSDSVFTKIIKGELPSYKIYEDEDTLAILDIHPLQPGHVLVISKKQVNHLWDLPEKDYQAVLSTAKKVANRIRDKLSPGRVGLKVAGEDIPHVHLHLIPYTKPEEFHQRSGPFDPDPAILKAMVAKLAF